VDELRVRIVELPPLRVASAHAYGSSPEHSAWEKLIAWANPKGLLEDPQAHRIFGFNNPDPSPGSPNYGYEFWIVVGPEVVPEGEIKIVDFAGGRYAVARCETRGDMEKIGETWQRLVVWREKSAHGPAYHQWLEEHLGYTDEADEELILDLHMPIAG
jgi:AraC family transcriptional regulator